MGKILPILLALIGLGAGVGGGLMLRPDTAEMAAINPCGQGDPNAHATAGADTGQDKNPPAAAYVKLNNQFVVPVVTGDRISSLVVMSLSLEIDEGGQEAVFQREPKLRDAFLQVLFDHANAGGFDGAFTASGKMVALRDALLEAAQKTLGALVANVLIVDLVRQDA